MKIAVYDPLKAFTPFIEHLGKSHEVTYIDIPVSLDELRWQHISNDIVWYEFCDEVFHRSIAHPKECVLVNRLHSYELFTDVPGKADWGKVDLLVASSREVKSLLESKREIIDFPPIRVLANGPDLDKIKPPDDKQYGKNIAVVGALNYKKNLPLAVYCLERLKGHGYTMHFIGESQDLRFDYYLKHMVKNLGLENDAFFHGGMPHEDVMLALQNCDYILSTSLYESFGQGIMEGIASGCLPLLHDFPGAKERFGELFPCFFNVPQEFRGMTVFYENMPNKTKQDIAASNIEAIKQYELKVQFAALDSIIEEAGGMIGG